MNLHDLERCLEGVVPALVATVSGDGTPNISYLSHVTMLDARHVGLTNQFFLKTAANLRDNPRATILMLDGASGEQFILHASHVGAEHQGPHFERLAARVAASSMHKGLADVMRLRQVDVLRVDGIEAVPVSSLYEREADACEVTLQGVQRIVERLSELTDVGEIIDAALCGLERELGVAHALVLEHDVARGRLTTLGSHGYPPGGIGSEVSLDDEGVIGVAARTRQVVAINEVSRTQRLSHAISLAGHAAGEVCVITLPGLPDALSRIAVPMVFRGALLGVLLAESRRPLAFTREVEAAICLVVRHACALLAWRAPPESDAQPGAPMPPACPSGQPVEVFHYAFDDSVFIDNQYAIKGVAGRLLYYMLAAYSQCGKREFTNRELRLDQCLKLPDPRTNIETRLLLLRRRLEEKSFPIRLQQLGRGRIGLDCAGPVRLTHAHSR